MPKRVTYNPYTTYTIRLTEQDKRLIEQAAALAGRGTAEFWREIMVSVSQAMVSGSHGGAVPPEEVHREPK